MTSFMLKIYAAFFMVVDHLKYVLPGFECDFTKVLGRLSFPAFAFLVAEGCVHTKDIKKYSKRLFIFALISQIPFYLFLIVTGLCTFDEYELDVMFTMLAGVGAIIALKQENLNKVLKVVLVFGGAVLAEVLHTDYGAVGVFTIVIYYLLRERKLLKHIIVSLLFVFNLMLSVNFEVKYYKYALVYAIGYVLSQVVLLTYNGQKGKYSLKYFFYWFYPIHLLILSIMRVYLTPILLN